MKRIIYTRPDGGLSVVCPVINTHPVPETLTEDEALERARKAIPADAINPQIVEEAAIPTDRTFRNAWKAGTGRVEHDMPKAREIHRNKMRDARVPKLQALDVEYMRADEAGDAAKKLDIAAKKKALRDVTTVPEIEAATTPETLKTVWPECLK